jgi:raffinose/stachyose/melibiose transport system permease protein
VRVQRVVLEDHRDVPLLGQHVVDHRVTDRDRALADVLEPAALPREITEAAMIDGASHFKTFFYVVLPLSRAAIFTVIILNGVWMWNDFFIALVLTTNPNVATLPLGILNFFGTYSTEWGLIFASVVIAALPVVALYLMMTKRFIAGLTAGSVKG